MLKGSKTFDVYVSGLPNDIGEDTLKQEFSTCGGVHSVTVKDGKNNTSKFAFVRYFTEDAQETAAAQLNGKYVKGKVLGVRKADYKKKSYSDNALQNGESKRQQHDYQANSPRRMDSAPTEYIEQAILITYVVDSCTVFAQLAHRDMAEVSAKLMMEINQYCPVAQPEGLHQPDLNKVYGALFSEDGMWYRCKIIPPLDGSSLQNKVAVHYLDYGNEEIVEGSSLVELPMSLASLPPQAHRLVFRGIKPTAQTPEENAKAVEFLQEVTEGKSVLARLYRPLQTTSTSTPVEIYDGNSGLNDVLLQRGFAFMESSIGTTNMPPSKPKVNTTPSPSKKALRTGSPSSKVGRKDGPGLLETPGPIVGKRSPPVQKPNAGGISVEKHQNEVQALMKEIAHLKTDKTELIKKCQDCMNEVAKVNAAKNTLQTDLQSVKEAASDTLTCLQKFEEKYKTALQTKTTGLLKTLATLKRIRKQVVIDPNVRDPVENAITLLTNSKDIFVSLRDGINEEAVLSAQTELNKHQAIFYDADAKDHLDELIVMRNEARLKMYDVLSNFLETVNRLPLEEKKADIQSSLRELGSTYETVLDDIDANLPTGTNNEDQVSICAYYKQWKEMKRQQLKSLRETTDELAANWHSTVHKNLVNPFDLTSDLSNHAVPELDDLARQLIVAMETEIAMTGQDKGELQVDPELQEKKKKEDVQETAILFNTVRVVVLQLRHELDAIDYITRQKTTYTATRLDLEKWLKAKPDVSGLQAVQKVIKGLKSKLRHKLADKDDLEEDPELNSGGELQQIAEDLTVIRLELQKAYVEEDTLMEEISELSRAHFPELSLQYPSFDIKHFLDTSGLVKRSRDLQQFDLKPLPGCDKKMIRVGEYDGRPIVVKSFFIPDDNTRSEFLSRLVQGSISVYEGVLKPEVVYALPGQGEVHIQLPYIKMGSLEAAIDGVGPFASEPLLPRELQLIFRDVLAGIVSLHTAGIVHGAVNPRNVLLTSRCSAVLAEYNSSKTHTQRAKEGYKSKNGLEFSHAESQGGNPASMDLDLYSFGILLLWAHYPTVKLPTLSNSTPDLSSVEIYPSLKEVVSKLISHVQNKNPSAEDFLTMDYFANLPNDDDIVKFEEEEGVGIEIENVGNEDGRVDAETNSDDSLVNQSFGLGDRVEQTENEVQDGSIEEKGTGLTKADDARNTSLPETEDRIIGNQNNIGETTTKTGIDETGPLEITGMGDAATTLELADAEETENGVSHDAVMHDGKMEGGDAGREMGDDGTAVLGETGGMKAGDGATVTRQGSPKGSLLLKMVAAMATTEDNAKDASPEKQNGSEI